MNEPARAVGERLAVRVSEAAELLSVPRSTLHDMVRRGILRAIRIGPNGPELADKPGRRGVVLIPVAELHRLLEVKGSGS